MPMLPSDFWGLGETIRPTGHCFDDVFDFFTKNRVPVSIWDQYRIVHGICIVPTTEDEHFAHAWIQEIHSSGHVNVIQGGLYDGRLCFFTVTQPFFEEKLRPQRATHYTILEAIRENDAANHFGPWIKEYEDLCRSGPRRGERLIR